MAIDTEERTSDDNKAVKSDGQTTPSKNNKKLIIIIVSIVAALIVLSIIGTIVAGFVAKKAFDTGLDAVTDGKMQIDADGDGESTMTFEGEDGETMTVESGKELPEDLPSATPLYDGAKLVRSSSTTIGDEGTMYTLAFNTSDSSDQVFDFYKDVLNGGDWKNSYTRSSDSSYSMISSVNEKADISVSYSDMPLDDESGTEFQLMVRTQVTEDN